MSKFKVGDIVEHKGDLGDHGKVMKGPDSDGYYEVLFDSMLGCTSFWTEEELQLVSEASESSVKPSDTVTLTITFPEGTNALEGIFESNKGLYEVKIERVE